MVTAPTLQLLEWIGERERTYAETMDAWRSHCPRLTIWEDAIADGLVQVRNGTVLVAPPGLELLGLTPESHGDESAARKQTAGGRQEARGLCPRAFPRSGETHPR